MIRFGVILGSPGDYGMEMDDMDGMGMDGMDDMEGMGYDDEDQMVS